MRPIADTGMLWTCACGVRSFNHHENCDSCGTARPAPPPAAEPSDKMRSEATKCALGDRYWIRSLHTHE